MRHGIGHRKLNRTSAHRGALFRNMATSLLRIERFETTIQKAKELKPIVEKLITLARVDNIHSRRKAYGYLLDKAVVHKLFAELGPAFKSRTGGYTRIVRTGYRHGDAAEMAVIELIQDGRVAVESKTTSEGKSKKVTEKKSSKESKETKTAEKAAKSDAAGASKPKKKVADTRGGDTAAKKKPAKKNS